jgi:ribosomal protein S18 acetylase RimI-like enzyme
VELRAVKPTDLQDLLRFTDAHIGYGYFDKMTGLHHINNSRKDGVNCSFILLDDQGEIQGLRLSFPPEQWQPSHPKDISPNLWIPPGSPHPIPMENVAYFKSLFVAPKYQGQGWGQKLSQLSLTALQSLGAQAIVTHSWIQSPNNTSNIYLARMGFQTIARHDQFWKEVDYICTRCGNPCLCDAMEMILFI